MGKIGDLWVRLGLKKQDFDKGLDESSKKLSTFGKVIKGIGTAAAVSFASIATTALTVFSKIALASNKLGDRWRETVGGMQNAWNTFTDSLLNWDWEGFWDRVRGSYSGGKALAGASDALFEQMNSLRMRRADMEAENAKLRIVMNDQNKTYAEREAAARKYLANVKPLYDEEADIQLDYLRKVEGAWLKGAGIDTMSSVTWGKLENFLKNGARLTDSMARDADYQKIAKYYDAMGDAINGPIVEAYEKAMRAAGAFESENRRVFNSLNTAIKGGFGGGSGGGAESSSPLAGSLAKLYEDLKKAEDAANNAVGATAQRQAAQTVEEIKKKIAEMESAVQNSITPIPKLSGIGPGALDVSSTLAGYDELVAKVKQASRETAAANIAMENSLVDLTETMERLSEDFAYAVTAGFSSGIQELTDQLLGLESMNPGRVFQALLSPLADLAVREGEIVLATGLGIEAVKTSLEALQGVDAIAAGAALIAIGAAAKSGLAALAKGGSGTTANYSGAGAGAGGGQTIRSELVVRVEGTIKGRDIVISGQNTLKDQRR